MSSITSILEKLDAEKMSVDEIKKLIKPFIKGLTIDTPILPSGQFFYRARKVDSTLNKKVGIQIKDLIYPSSEKVGLGRLNRSGQPIFYCSLSKEPIFFELPNINNNDELIVSFWQSKEKMLVNNIGYTAFLFEKLGARRSCPTWTTTNSEIILNDESLSSEAIKLAYSRDENRIIREAISNAFMCDVSDNKSKYKITTAISELHLGRINNFPLQFSGILYPSLRVKGDGDNVALLPEFVDNNLKLKKAIHIKIENKGDKKINITYLDHASSFSADGNLQWLGRLPQWESRDSALAKCIAGIDNNGDYLVSKDGTQCHWLVTDQVTGKIILPT